MEIQTDQGKLQIILEETEAQFLSRLLQAIAGEYRFQPENLDSKARSVLYSPQGHLSVGWSEEEKEEWNRALFEFRGENRQRIERWIASLEEKFFPFTWTILPEDIDPLLIVLNDYRLVTASKHDFDQQELDYDFSKFEEPLKRIALYEVFFLGLLMERIIEIQL